MMIHKCRRIRFTGREIKKGSTKKTVIRLLQQFYMKDAIKAARKRAGQSFMDNFVKRPAHVRKYFKHQKVAYAA